MYKLIVITLFTLFSQALLADWTLDNSASTFNFLSTKKGTVTEIHSFKQLSGSVSAKGEAALSIELASVETNIAIRNERMRDLLFQVANFTNAAVTLSFDPAVLANLHAGKRVIIQTKVMLDLHGISKELPAELIVTGLENDAIQVHTLKPLLLKAADFELISGVEALRTVAKLSSIDTTIPVSFTLIFQKD